MAKDKKLEARVKQDFQINRVMAFSGVEFVKSEWRPVPAGHESEALKHDFLDAREVKAGTVESAEAKSNPSVRGEGGALDNLEKGTADKTVDEFNAEPKTPSRRGRKPKSESES